MAKARGRKQGLSRCLSETCTCADALSSRAARALIVTGTQALERSAEEAGEARTLCERGRLHPVPPAPGAVNVLVAMNCPALCLRIDFPRLLSSTQFFHGTDRSNVCAAMIGGGITSSCNAGSKPCSSARYPIPMWARRDHNTLRRDLMGLFWSPPEFSASGPDSWTMSQLMA